MKRQVSPFSLIVIFILMAFALIPMQTAAARSVDDSLPEPTVTFISLITDFFQEPGNTSILDPNGKNINIDFFVSHYDEYRANNYKPMWDEFKTNSLSIEFDGSLIKPLSILTFEPSKNFYQLCTTANGWKTVEAKITLASRYTVNDSSGTITGANSPSLSVEYLSVGANFTATTQSVSTWKTIASDKKSVTFSGKFSVQVSQKESNVIIWTSNAGPYTKSFTASA